MKTYRNNKTTLINNLIGFGTVGWWSFINFWPKTGPMFIKNEQKMVIQPKNVSISRKNTVIKKAIKVFDNDDDLLENIKVHIGNKNWAFWVPKGTKVFFCINLHKKTIFWKGMTQN